MGMKTSESDSVMRAGICLIGLMSNHLLVSCELFYEHMGKLFTAINTHGYQPKDILLSIITSIPKDGKGNVCSGTNYRGITLYSSISKLMDIVMVIRFGLVWFIGG